MELSLNKDTALCILRQKRIELSCQNTGFVRTDIVAPNPNHRKRWTKDAIVRGLPDSIRHLLEGDIFVAVPSAEMRIRAKGVSSTVYERPLPTGSFIVAGNDLAISGPELLFAELASKMQPIERVMLAHELCGSFGRDAADPRNGPVTYGLKPLTSVARIRAFLENAAFIRGIGAAREVACYLDDHAWAPTVSLLTAFLRLPIDSFGFEFGELELNERISNKHGLPGSKESRVPDILIKGTSVGLNYDGLVHLDLDSIARAAMDAGMNPESSQALYDLRRAIDSVRLKVVDDVRRNRELTAEGLNVLPVLKEDLYQQHGLERLVSRLVDMLNQEAYDLRQPRRALRSKRLCEDRYRLLLSLLPGRKKLDTKLGRYIQGHEVVEGLTEESCFWIEL